LKALAFVWWVCGVFECACMLLKTNLLGFYLGVNYMYISELSYGDKMRAIVANGLQTGTGG
jgi:hypothetical protein